MSYWNFRTVKKDEYFAIYYAYYSDEGKLQALSEFPVSPISENLEDLRGTLKAMQDSCEDDVIDFSTLKPLNNI